MPTRPTATPARTRPFAAPRPSAKPSRSGDAASARDQPADAASTQAGTAGAGRRRDDGHGPAGRTPVIASRRALRPTRPRADGIDRRSDRSAPGGGHRPGQHARAAAAWTHPRFAQALGTQVSLLARDGVHEAPLQLNPAEMGPVSVQIVLDGTQARVEFGADMARTREVIERSLPELAAALRDAGLTLTRRRRFAAPARRGDGQSEPDGQRGRAVGTDACRSHGRPSLGDPQTTPTRALGSHRRTGSLRLMRATAGRD